MHIQVVGLKKGSEHLHGKGMYRAKFCLWWGRPRKKRWVWSYQQVRLQLFEETAIIIIHNKEREIQKLLWVHLVKKTNCLCSARKFINCRVIINYLIRNVIHIFIYFSTGRKKCQNSWSHLKDFSPRWI